MGKLNNILLAVRDSNMLLKPCISILLRNELSTTEIVSYKFINKHPSIELEDGTILSSYEDQSLPHIKNSNIPYTHLACVLNYILRYKYPHSKPDCVIDTRPIPRKLFPSVIHRQHLNTFYDVNNKSTHTQQLIDIFSIKKRDMVLELGSFIGMGTVKLSKCVGECGKIVTVEADKIAHLNLKLNLNNNKIKNVNTLNCAVSYQNHEKQIIYKDRLQKNSIIKNVIDDKKSKYIQGKTLETICKESNINPTFIIMTINGAEYKVLQSSSAFLQNSKELRIIVPGWYKDDIGKTGPRIINLLETNGFSVSFTKGMHIFAYKKAII